MRLLRSLLVALALLSAVPVVPACCAEPGVADCCSNAPACPVDAGGTCVLAGEDAPMVAPQAPAGPSAAAVLAAPFAAFDDRGRIADLVPPRAADPPPRFPPGIRPLRI